MTPKDSRYNSYDLSKKYCDGKTDKNHFDKDEYEYTFACPNVAFEGWYGEKTQGWVEYVIWTSFIAGGALSWFGLPIMAMCNNIMGTW